MGILNERESRRNPLSDYIEEIRKFLAKEEYTSIAFPDTERRWRTNVYEKTQEHNIQLVIPEQT